MNVNLFRHKITPCSEITQNVTAGQTDNGTILAKVLDIIK